MNISVKTKRNREIVIKSVPPNDIDIETQIVNFLKEHFHNDEPINKSISLPQNANDSLILEELYKFSLRSNANIFATDSSGEILGVLLNVILDKNGNEDFVPSVEPTVAYGHFLDTLDDIIEKVDVFKVGNTEKCLEHMILSVSPLCQGEGIGKLLVEASKSLASSLQCKAIVTICTSLFSAKVFLNCGYEEVFREKISAHCYDGDEGMPMFPVEKPHEYFTCLIYKL